MAERGSAPSLLADVGALLDHVGERGVLLTDTGRLRMADVRAINDRFAVPAELTERFGQHIHRARREDEVWRVHFVRLVAQAAGLIDARRGRLRRTASASRLLRLVPDEAEGQLFVAWWWKGAWDLISLVGAIDVSLMRDRLVTASALAELGTLTHRIDALGARLRKTFGAPVSSHFALSDEAWGFASWRVCLEPLAAFGGARPSYTSRELNGHRSKDLSAVALTERGIGLVQAALAVRPVPPARIRRGMVSAYPVVQRGAGDASELMGEDERRELILAEHPEYRDAIERGDERVGDVNPRAHLATHEAIAEQLAASDPAEVRAAYERLVELGHDEHAVRHALADALVREIWRAQSERAPVNRERYAARLAAMPETPDDADEQEALEPLPPARLPVGDRERLRPLPRASRAWEGDLTDLPIEIERLGAPLCALWADGDGTVRAVLPDVGAEPGQLALAAFVRAALRPQTGRAELPERVRVHPEIASALRDPLGEVGVAVEEAEDLPLAHEAIESLTEYLARPRGSRRQRRRQRSR